MKVDLRITSHETLKKGDLLICQGDNSFSPIPKEELFFELTKEVNRLNEEIQVMKQFLKVYQEETTKLLKGVLNNG